MVWSRAAPLFFPELLAVAGFSQLRRGTRSLSLGADPHWHSSWLQGGVWHMYLTQRIQISAWHTNHSCSSNALIRDVSRSLFKLQETVFSFCSRKACSALWLHLCSVSYTSTAYRCLNPLIGKYSSVMPFVPMDSEYVPRANPVLTGKDA